MKAEKSAHSHSGTQLTQGSLALLLQQFFYLRQHSFLSRRGHLAVVGRKQRERLVAEPHLLVLWKVS